MSDEISRVLNNLAVDEQNLRKAYDMPFLAHRQKEAREIIVALKARNERLEKALEGVSKWNSIGLNASNYEQWNNDMKEAKAVLEEGKK